MKIHHTMGVYANGDRKHNGVSEDFLAGHIEYNKNNRPGRALFVDGKCAHQGYLMDNEVKRIERELELHPILMPKDTQPYI